MSVFSKGIGVAVGMGDVPAVSIGSVFTGGAVPAVTRVAFSDGTTLLGDAGLTYTAASDLLAINNNAASPLAVTTGALFQISGVDALNTRMEIVGYGGSPAYVGRRANGTAAIPTAVVNGSQLVGLAGLGYGTAWETAGAGSVSIQGAETWDNTNQATKITFSCTPTGGSKTQATKFTLTGQSATFASGVPVTISDSTASTTVSTGALIVGGGVGVAGLVVAGGGLTASAGNASVNAGRYNNISTAISTAAGTGVCSWWRSGGTIGTAGDFVLQTDLGVTNAAFVFRAGPTTPITVATLSGAAVAGTTPGFSTVGLSTITGGVTDGYNSASRQTPTYDAATALTVTRHNYFDLVTPGLTGAGPAALTDACVFRFGAAAGTHKAVDAATTKTTPNLVDAWVKVNVNGVVLYMPAYTSKTA